ncbi:MAG: hypothetical protein IJ594_10495 [Oscillospiraceae bacterium]|nr:hypothetical protein [Oscillospiraceae bacterium]
MRTVRKTSVFPAERDVVFTELQKLSTLQYIAAPFASFVPVDASHSQTWTVGSTSAYRFRLFGLIPFGTHTIRIERFDRDGVSSREGNEHVPVWNHRIYLKDRGSETEYTDEVDICAGWKTAFVWLWAKAFYAHRQKKWIRLLRDKGNEYHRH